MNTKNQHCFVSTLKGKVLPKYTFGNENFVQTLSFTGPLNIFQQVEGVRLFNEHDFYETISRCKSQSGSNDSDLKVFELGERNLAKQATHSLDAARMIEIDLKNCLLGLTKELFGQGDS